MDIWMRPMILGFGIVLVLWIYLDASKLRLALEDWRQDGA